jgi:hypothetical protein
MHTTKHLNEHYNHLDFKTLSPCFKIQELFQNSPTIHSVHFVDAKQAQNPQEFHQFWDFTSDLPQ